MKTIKLNLYKFEELSEEAQEKAIENNIEINVDYNWWDSEYDDAENIGLKITSFSLDRNRGAEGEFLLSANEVAQNIFNNHGGNCETYKTASEFMENWQPVFNEYMKDENSDLEDDLQELEDEFLKDLLEDYSIMLQNQSEYLQSEEAIKETLIANEYDFSEDGEMY